MPWQRQKHRFRAYLSNLRRLNGEGSAPELSSRETGTRTPAKSVDTNDVGPDLWRGDGGATPNWAILAVGVGLALLNLAMPEPALAHVEIDVGDGRYVMDVGFRDEPAFLGQPNAVYLNVQEYATGGTNPVDGLAATLQAEVSRDGKSLSVPLKPLSEGAYEGAFVPTATGDYTFHVFGSIGDAPVDERVTSGPSTFDSVEPLSTIEFPIARPDPVQLQVAVTEAVAAATMARTLGIAGIAVGVLGLILGGIALARSGRSRVQALPAPPPQAGEPSGKLIR